jgi:hypothetical protein
VEVASLPDTGRFGPREYDATMGPPLEGPRRSPRLRAQEEMREAAEAGMAIERDPRYPLIAGPTSLFACPPLAHYYQVRPRGCPNGRCPVCFEMGPAWVPCSDCQDFGTLFVPWDADRREVVPEPLPLVWLSRVVALHLHQEDQPDVAHAHFSILLASQMSHGLDEPSAPL